MSSQQSQSKREMPAAEVVHLAELVNYQEGAVKRLAPGTAK